MKISTREAIQAMRNNYQPSNDDQSGGFNDDWYYKDLSADTSAPLKEMAVSTKNMLKAHTEAHRASESYQDGNDIIRNDVPDNLGTTQEPEGYNFNSWYEERGQYLDRFEFEDVFSTLKSGYFYVQSDNSGLDTICKEENFNE